MKFKFILYFLLIVNTLFAQKEANNWYFGNFSGITFNTDPPTALLGNQIFCHEGSASISDVNGNLLFYTNGTVIRDSTHSVMLNGSGLMSNISTTQCLIIPAPGNNTIYYVISGPQCTSNDPMVYSIVDMTLNGGLGGVSLKNIPLLYSSTEKVTAVQHSNGIDIWLITHSTPGNEFHSFLITSLGIDTNSVVSNVGLPLTNSLNKIGYLKASPCGSLIAMACTGGSGSNSFLEMFDFNNATGVVSNPILLDSVPIAFTSISGYYGIEFSPDNSKLYTTLSTNQVNSLSQFDLNAGNASAIIASKTVIGGSSSFGFGALQTGPDGRIYVGIFTQDSLACITNPNEIGTLCNFIGNFVTGASTTQIGLPSFVSSWFCNIPSSTMDINSEKENSVFPNPAVDFVTFTSSSNFVIEKLLVYDVTGKLVLEKLVGNSSTLDVSGLSPAIYFYEARSTKGERVYGNFLKQ